MKNPIKALIRKLVKDEIDEAIQEAEIRITQNLMIEIRSDIDLLESDMNFENADLEIKIDKVQRMVERLDVDRVSDQVDALEIRIDSIEKKAVSNG